MDDHPAPVAAAIDEAMRRQLAALAEAGARGVPRVGFKVGFHDAAAQQRLGIGAPLLGVLDGARLIPPGGAYHPRPGGRPFAEVEVALHIGAALAGEVSLEAARAAIVGVAPAFEFIDTTKPGVRRDALGEMVANGIMHDACAFGTDQPYERLTAMLQAGLPSLRRGGEVVREGEPGRVPTDVATVVQAAAAILGRYGASLEPGDRIICGSYIDPLEIRPGDDLTADLGPVGQLQVTIGKPLA